MDDAGDLRQNPGFRLLECFLPCAIDEESFRARAVNPGVGGQRCVFRTVDGQWYTYDGPADRLDRHASEEDARSCWSDAEA